MTSTTNPVLKISFLGFGEAGRAFAQGWKGRQDLQLAAFDIKSLNSDQSDAIEAAGAALDVVSQTSLQAAMAQTDLVFSFVTADQAYQAACDAAMWLPAKAIFIDCNSCSPGTKKRSLEIMKQRGRHYVDMAVMAPVHPKLQATPVLYSSMQGENLAAIFERLGMNATWVGSEIGRASSIKMMRSIMIKGFEALTAECVLAARRAGVEEQVLASLQMSDPGFDWTARSAYNLERMMVHGARRAAEMREVAATLRELGLPDRMATATVAWQDELARLELTGGAADLQDRADRVLKVLSE